MLDWVGEISGGRKGLCLLGDYFFFQASLSLSLSLGKGLKGEKREARIEGSWLRPRQTCFFVGQIRDFSI
jgi:hypothetical protein